MARRSIRLISTPQSALAKEPSWLAIAETLIAFFTVIGICIWSGSIRWILLPAAVAPLLLLRTRLSDRKTRDLFICLSDAAGWLGRKCIVETVVLCTYLSLDIKKELPQPLNKKATRWWIARVLVMVAVYCPLSILIIALILPLARFLGVVLAFSRHPVRSLRSIPSNWWRVCVCTDIRHPPEIIPGSETMSPKLAQRLQVFRLSRWLRYGYALSKHGGKDFVDLLPEGETIPEYTWRNHLQTHFLAIVFFISWYFPAYFYRLSLKSTSVVLAPLAISARKINESLDCRLDDLLTGNSERLQRWYALLVFTFTVGAIAVTALRPNPEASTSLNNTISTPPTLLALSYLYWPAWDGVLRVKGWHLARIINALLLFGGYLYADRAARRLRMKVWRPKHVEFILNVLFVVQWAISAYLWICGLLCFWHFMREPGFLPTFQVQFFP